MTGFSKRSWVPPGGLGLTNCQSPLAELRELWAVLKEVSTAASATARGPITASQLTIVPASKAQQARAGGPWLDGHPMRVDFTD